ncbi:hypothetical protein GCM10017774_72590 [Lentzea cavernae]|uniref:Uncharacterized protein n=1 Tax=Lentzea cavernae TaxID=2020703 RepID=A0ABQ3MZC6_9PSEU|nr:hypothetical protein GCM10017774_72590 [Lentzea cavernae]
MRTWDADRSARSASKGANDGMAAKRSSKGAGSAGFDARPSSSALTTLPGNTAGIPPDNAYHPQSR